MLFQNQRSEAKDATRVTMTYALIPMATHMYEMVQAARNRGEYSRGLHSEGCLHSNETKENPANVSSRGSTISQELRVTAVSQRRRRDLPARPARPINAMAPGVGMISPTNVMLIEPET